jgi:hypothetical protein
MMSAKGDFIGQVCHIEAAEFNGPRFNPKQTEEERRGFGNLMLMCYPHHKETDDAGTYPVARLQEMKATHEAKFTDVVRKMQMSVEDQTKKDRILPPKTMSKLNKALGWNVSQSELEETMKEAVQLAEALRKLPRDARQLLAVIVERVFHVYDPEEGYVVPASEIERVTSLPLRDMRGLMQMLIRYRFVFVDDPLHDDETGEYIDASMRLGRKGLEWRSFWEDLVKFCKMTKIPIEHFIVDLRFDAFD